MTPQDAVVSAAVLPPPCSVAVPRTEFRQPDAELLPGRPLDPTEMQAPPPPGCATYLAIFVPFFFRALCSPDALAGGFLFNLPELRAYTRRSKRWIYRGFRVLAAHGILYSTRVRQEEGRDRRRYRVRYWLRCDAQISAEETAEALRAIFFSNPDDDDDSFPGASPWVGRGRAIHVPPEALAQVAARAAGAPPLLVGLPAEQVAAAAVRAAGVPEIAPLAAMSPVSPLDTRQELPGTASRPTVASSPAAPGSGRRRVSRCSCRQPTGAASCSRFAVVVVLRCRPAGSRRPDPSWDCRSSCDRPYPRARGTHYHRAGAQLPPSRGFAGPAPRAARSRPRWGPGSHGVESDRFRRGLRGFHRSGRRAVPAWSQRLELHRRLLARAGYGVPLLRQAVRRGVLAGDGRRGRGRVLRLPRRGRRVSVCSFAVLVSGFSTACGKPVDNPVDNSPGRGTYWVATGC